MPNDNNQTKNPNTEDDLTLDFDIMLDPHEEENKPKEEINQTEQASQESNTDLNFNIETPPEADKTKEIAPEKIETQEVTIPNEIKPQEMIAQEMIQKTETPVIQEAIVEKIEQAIPQETLTPEIQETKLPENEEKSIQAKTDYNPDIQAVNETIQQLQEAREQGKQNISSNELNEMPTVATTDAKIIQQETQNTQTPINSISAGVMNLDDIISTPDIKTQSPIQDIPQVQFPQSVVQAPNPYNIPTENPAQTPVNNKEHKKHLIMIIGIVAICVLAGFFILKTMYPMQFGSENAGSGDTPAIEEQTPPPQEEIPSTDVAFTGESTEITGTDTAIDTLTGDTGSGNIQEHDASNTTDPFQDLDGLQNQDEQKKQATIDSLKDFANKGQYYLDLGKEKGIKDMIKYGVYLTGKASTFINQIENGEILDISSLDSYLAQFSISLQKLQDLENAPDTTQQEANNAPEENSGFNQTGEQETPPDGSTGENTTL